MRAKVPSSPWRAKIINEKSECVIKIPATQNLEAVLQEGKPIRLKFTRESLNSCLVGDIILSGTAEFLAKLKRSSSSEKIGQARFYWKRRIIKGIERDLLIVRFDKSKLGHINFQNNDVKLTGYVLCAPAPYDVKSLEAQVKSASRIPYLGKSDYWFLPHDPPTPSVYASNHHSQIKANAPNCVPRVVHQGGLFSPK